MVESRIPVERTAVGRINLYRVTETWDRASRSPPDMRTRRRPGNRATRQEGSRLHYFKERGSFFIPLDSL